MTLRMNLGRYLKDHGISAYRLVQEVGGSVAPNTVYSLARRPAQRVDLNTVGKILRALGQVRGEAVDINEVLEDVPPAEPASLTAELEPPLYDPKKAKLFRPSGKIFDVKPGGPSIEQMIAEDRGRTAP